MNDKPKKPQKLRARQPRGFVDRSPDDIRATDKMVAKIREVYERYGFDPVETPMMEYTDCLGKFLPDTDRPNEGVFSVQDDDEQWMSLRYDLTAPLARHVAENINEIQLPYRTYRQGWVFRNEKPGPGRFRQFMQFDADTVGAPGVQADAEMCMMMADTMEALRIKRGDYVIRVNNRKVLDSLMACLGLGGQENEGRRLGVLRALDKLDRLGSDEVSKLLGPGRRDESGDWMEGVKLSSNQLSGLGWLLTTLSAFKKGEAPKKYIFVNRNIVEKENLVGIDYSIDNSKNVVMDENDEVYKNSDYLIYSIIIGMGLEIEFVDGSPAFSKKNGEITTDEKLLIDSSLETLALLNVMRTANYDVDRVVFDLTCVRGLEYYTGPVYEAELLFDVTNEKGEKVQFGSVGGGGRYDGLVKRFTGQDVPATGFSIGVSRLMTALKNLGKLDVSDVIAPVLVTVMDRDTESLGRYQKMTQELRNANIRAEMFQGNPKDFPKQLRYADRRNCPIAIIQGGNERAEGKLIIKDLIEGKRIAATITDNAEWKEAKAGEKVIDEKDLVAEVVKMLAAQKA